MKVQIGIDLSAAAVNQAGTGIYIRRLIDTLIGVQGQDVFHLFSVNQQRDMSSRKSLRTRLDTLYRDLIWMHAVLPLQARRARVDVLHMPAGITPWKSSVPVVLTILDTILFQMPLNFPAWQRRYFLALGKWSAQQAAHILTISEQSKRDIISQFGVPPEKVTVTYLAAAPEFHPLPQGIVEVIRRFYGLKEHFILTVGTIEPRKNLGRLLESLARLKRENFQCQWVHVGPQGWFEEGLMKKINQLGLQESVHFLGRVPLSDLVGIYNAASLFVYPSLYEGFGLPVLEAMACGCPVVTSNTSSLPEVAGDAAILVNPLDVDALSDNILQVLGNSNIANELRLRGLQRAMHFSWQQTALDTLRIYHEVAGK